VAGWPTRPHQPSGKCKLEPGEFALHTSRMGKTRNPTTPSVSTPTKRDQSTCSPKDLAQEFFKYPQYFKYYRLETVQISMSRRKGKLLSGHHGRLFSNGRWIADAHDTDLSKDSALSERKTKTWFRIQCSRRDETNPWDKNQNDCERFGRDRKGTGALPPTAHHLVFDWGVGYFGTHPTKPIKLYVEKLCNLL
jgi:hypothetical protein